VLKLELKKNYLSSSTELPKEAKAKKRFISSPFTERGEAEPRRRKDLSLLRLPEI